MVFFIDTGTTFSGEVRPSVVHEPKAYTKIRTLLAVTSTLLVG
jgi:hypothetical protein